jgi:predicted helicase
MTNEFNEIHVIDLGGDVRANPKLSGTKHNVFGIQTGVAISFMVKRAKTKGCRIFYARRPEFETAEEKLTFLSNTKVQDTKFEEIRPDVKNNWINQTDNDFDSLLPIATKEAKAAKTASGRNAIFGLFASGIKTNRDEWVYDDDQKTLRRKTQFLVEHFNAQLKRGTLNPKSLDYSNKWSSGLKTKRDVVAVDKVRFISSLFRPFMKRWYCTEKTFSDRLTVHHYRIFGPELKTSNPTIAFLCVFSSNPLAAMIVSQPFDYCLLKQGNGGTESVSLWTHDEHGRRQENITDWALHQFSQRYQSDGNKKPRAVTKETIFQYVYGVPHDPIYREKYALNLKREFPRIPLYKDFWQWADWGKELMELHIGYESVAPAKLKRIDVPDEKARKVGLSPKCILKADKEAGQIVVDSETAVTGIPLEAWEYRLGNRTALEWILDQYKEKKPKDPTIREKFNTYRFADYKEKVIDLLLRVTTVSVRTVTIVSLMKTAQH